jgi:hypothetical protein
VTIHRSEDGAYIELSKGARVAVRLLPISGEGRDILYEWPTSCSPHQLIERCIPYKTSGFRSVVEVVVFPTREDTQSSTLPYKEYMAKGPKFDSQLAAVRFNAGAHDGFSVLWARRHEGRTKGQVKAVFASAPDDIVKAMIEGSIIKSATQHVATIVQEGRRLQDARR